MFESFSTVFLSLLSVGSDSMRARNPKGDTREKYGDIVEWVEGKKSEESQKC